MHGYDPYYGAPPMGDPYYGGMSPMMAGPMYPPPQPLPPQTVPTFPPQQPVPRQVGPGVFVSTDTYYPDYSRSMYPGGPAGRSAPGFMPPMQAAPQPMPPMPSYAGGPPPMMIERQFTGMVGDRHRSSSPRIVRFDDEFGDDEFTISEDALFRPSKSKWRLVSKKKLARDPEIRRVNRYDTMDAGYMPAGYGPPPPTTVYKRRP